MLLDVQEQEQLEEWQRLQRHREQVDRQRQERKDRAVQIITVIFSIAFWGGLAWAVLDDRSFSAFCRSIGF